MALRVSSSSPNVVLNYAAVATLAVGIALFLRHRRISVAEPTAPSLAQKDVSVIRSLPGIGRAVNYFFPMKAAEPPVISIGSSSALIGSVEELTRRLVDAKKELKEPCTLIIYGNHLQIVQDPGILALNPMKLILVGAQIDHSTDPSSLAQCMINNGWLGDTNGLIVVNVRSVDEALKIKVPLTTNATTKPILTAYSVEA
jgi:hypothetical protein